MNMPGHNREHRVRLPQETTKDMIALIMRDLREVEAVTARVTTDHDLKIQYVFPLPGFDTVWQIINKHIGSTAFPALDRFRYSLAAYMESIEREHLHSHCGWGKYIQDIYVSHYHHQHINQPGQKRMQWQQYKPVKPDKLAGN